MQVSKDMLPEHDSVIEGSELLDPPGAGLPWLELVVIRSVFGVLRALLRKEQIDAWFLAEQYKILVLVDEVEFNHGSRRVLISRVTGIEDSSRNWSVFMTLEHLNIVNRAIANIVTALSKNLPIAQEVSVAEVKPAVEEHDEICKKEAAVFAKEKVEKFASTCGFYRSALHRVNLSFLKFEGGSSPTHQHPWFGSLNAHEWHLLAAVHMRIHRQQISRILHQLK
ncbi:MAG: hypothetical protein ACPG32_14915 [Akkermansiaceae bacterium]